MWLALKLKKSVTVGVLGHERELHFSDMADGCCGVLLAFESKEAAAGYVGEGGAIVEIQEMSEAVETVEPSYVKECRALAKNGLKLAAVKLWRSRTGTGLKEAMYAVEAL